MDQNERFDFGAAIRQLKIGRKVSRDGWNGKNQYVILAENISYETKGSMSKREMIRHDAIGNQCLVFVGTSGTQMGWLASQADMLAEDWHLYIEG